MKHTKGPWTYDETYGLIMAGETIEVAACHAGRGGDAKANARLIAAAPEMLDRLYECLGYVEANEAEWSEPSVIQKLLRETIAKIEGK
jgi:hypothetical protein